MRVALLAAQLLMPGPAPATHTLSLSLTLRTTQAARLRGIRLEKVRTQLGSNASQITCRDELPESTVPVGNTFM